MASNTSPVICTPQCRQTPPACDETLRVTNMMPEVPASASPALGPRAGLNKNVVTQRHRNGMLMAIISIRRVLCARSYLAIAGLGRRGIVHGQQHISSH